MLVIALVLGMALLTYYFSGVEEAQRNPNHDPDSMVSAQTIEVPLRRNRMGHYVVTGSINNQPVEFLLDTGATDVVVPESIARQLGLPYGRPAQAMTANGAITVYGTHINELTVGEIRLYDIDASINPAVPGGAILMGMSALGQIEFTQSGDTLTLRQWAE